MNGARVFFLGNNVDTDQILPGYAMSYPPEQLGEVALAGSEIAGFAALCTPGDIVVAGENFGCGSSREQAPAALKACGVGAVVALSLARIFRRNAINIGLPVVTCGEIEAIRAQAEEGDRFAIDIEAGRLTNLTRGIIYPLDPLSESSLATLAAGGLVGRVRAKLRERGEPLKD